MRDPLAQTEAIRSEVFKALEEKHSTIETKNRSLRLSNFHSDPLPDPDDYARQKEILNLGKTEGVNIFGKVELIDKKTGAVIDSKEKMKLGFLPTATNRHSFIVNGKEYIVHNQLRLKAGVMTRKDRNGIPAADFNLAKGSNMSIQYQPDQRYMEVKAGTAKIPLYTILKDVYEIPDKTLIKSFGPEIHKQEMEALQNKNREKYLSKLHDSVTFKSSSGLGEEEVKNNLKNYFDSTKMDAINNRRTVGVESDKIEPKILVKAAQDVLDIYRGKKDPTWKDNIAFKEVHSTEDFLNERLTKTKRVNEMHMKIKPKIDKAQTVYDTGVGRLINANIAKFFKGSDLVNYPLQVNPMEFLENAHKITSLGEGGVESTDSLPVDARNLHLSQIGFIDPVRTPDNVSAGVDLRMSVFTSKEGKSLVIPVIDAKGKIVRMKHDDLLDHVYAVRTETPQKNGKYRAFFKGKMIEVDRNKIEYFIAPDSLFTVSTAAIPFKKNTQGQRSAMGAKMLTQALSLVKRELPIVDTKAAQLASGYYTPKAPVDGVVSKITPDYIMIKGKDNKEHKVNIPNKFSLNYHSYLHVDPSIKEGDKVRKDQILGDNNFTVDGKMALGINAKVAFMPYRGYNFEDGFVVTRQGADKLASNHVFQETLDLADPTIERDVKKYLAYFPQRFTVDQIGKLDNGIIKKGTKVYSGDPLILALQKRVQTPEALRQGLMTSRITRPYKDVSITWTRDYPGVVTEVVYTPKMVKVVIEATAPLVEGDKICVDELTEVFTKKGWKYITNVTIHDQVMMLKDGVETVWDTPLALHTYRGPHVMVEMSSEALDMFVTIDHYEVISEKGEAVRAKAKDLIGREFITFHQKNGLVGLQMHNKKDKEVIRMYDRPVYCLTTKYENFYIRRNGKERFTGNCSRFGSKGIVVKILENHEAPRFKDQSIPDVLVNPAAVPSRMNVGQIYEAQMAKVLQKIGKRVDYDDLNTRDTYKEVKGLMKKYKVKDTDTLYDPVSKRNVKDVFTGTQYFLKLAKQTETNFSARAGGDYDIDQRPVKGGEEGGKSIGTLDIYALLSHNARSILSNKGTQTSQYNPELWAAILSGQPLPPKKTTFAYNKTMEMLRGAGINVQKKGNLLHSLPFTDAEIKKMSTGAIKSAKMVTDKPDPATGLQFRPEKGGLFDPVRTGGLLGSEYSHIELNTPVIHKWFEDPVKTLLNLNTKEFNAIRDREAAISVKGSNQTGVEALQNKLKEIDVDKELRSLRIQIKRDELSLDKKNIIIKKIQFLKALKEYGMSPDKAYVNSLIPVIPPKYRPIYPKETGEVITSDANHLYREIIEINKSLESPLIKSLGKDSPDYKEKLKDLNTAIRKMQGVDKTENPDMRAPSGFVEIIKGKGQPKYGYFQHKVMSKVQDIVGRGTIAPDPKLGLDECSIPEEMAWTLYKPFVTGEMVKRGYEYDKAVEEIEKRTLNARNALIAEMQRRPVILNRAPTLHKFSMMAFTPKLNNTRTIYICPLVVKPFTADFDGDSSISSVFWRFNIADNKQSLYSSEYRNIFNKHEGDEMPTNSKVLNSNGLINLAFFPRIEETKETRGNIDYYQVPEGVEVLVLDNDRKYKWIKPESYSVHKELSLVNVKTHKSRSVAVSDDHSLVTLDDTGGLAPVQPKENLLIPVRVRPVFESKIEEIELNIKDVKERRNTFKEKMGLNYDTGYLLGCIVGDGWVSTTSNRRDLCFACITPEMDKKWKEVIEQNITNEEVHFSSVNADHEYEGFACRAQKITWSSAGDFAFLVKEWVGHKAQNKHLPPFFLESTITFRKGLLAGLIDTDGTVTNNASGFRKDKPQTQISITTTSKILAYEIVALGQSLGLCSYVTYSKTPKGEDCYVTVFDSESIIKLKTMLELYHPEKKQKLKDARTDVRINREKYSPPLTKERMAELRKEIGMPALYKEGTKILRTEDEEKLKEIKLRRSLYKSLYDAEKERNGRKGHLTLDNGLDILKLNLSLLNEHPFWKKWKAWLEDAETSWERVVSIESIPHITEAYDLTIPPAYTMVTDSGVVIWDTMTVHVTTSEEDILEAQEMRPSKNLFSPRNNTVNYKPDQEAIMGLYLGTKGNKGAIKTFKTVAEAKEAYNKGVIDADDRIKVMEL